jgi:hypothetical protein
MMITIHAKKYKDNQSSDYEDYQDWLVNESHIVWCDPLKLLVVLSDGKRLQVLSKEWEQFTDKVVSPTMIIPTK